MNRQTPRVALRAGALSEQNVPPTPEERDPRRRQQGTGPTGAVHLTGIIAAQGALPIKAGDEIIGAVGVSGAPGGEKEEACSKAGIDKVADQLK